MNTLGLADGPRPTAALIVSGSLVGLRRQHRSGPMSDHGVPWDAAKAVLHDHGLAPSDVDHVAVAGKYTPMLVLRQHPRLRRLGGGAFSVARDAHAFAQSILRTTGLGALESDRAAEWWHAELSRRGFHPRRVQLIAIHRALASAAYRCQPDDDVLVISLQPRGDGVVAAVHRGEAAYLERVWEQRGASALGVHLQRCADVLGISPATPVRELSSLAGDGVADASVTDALSEWLRVENGRIEGIRRPVPGLRRDAVYEQLAHLSRADAAASLLHNLREAVCGLVRWHLRSESVRDVMLSGALIQDPRLVARVASIEGVRSVSALPIDGAAALSVGAATSLAGTAPQALPSVGLGPQVDEAAAKAAIVAAGCKAVKRRNPAKWLADRLAAGQVVARVCDRGGLGPWGMGRAAVLVRADRPEDVQRARRGLGRSSAEQPGCLMHADVLDAELPEQPGLERALAHSAAAVPVGARLAEHLPGVMARDGRVELGSISSASDPILGDALKRLYDQTGCRGVACLPFAPADSAPIVDEQVNVQCFLTSRLDSLLIGPFGVEHPGS